MTPSEFQSHISSELVKASQQENPAKALEKVIGDFFPNLSRVVQDEVLHLRLSGTWFSIRAVGCDKFRTFENANRNGSPLSDFSEGKPCNSKELTLELAEFSGVNAL